MQPKCQNEYKEWQKFRAQKRKKNSMFFGSKFKKNIYHETNWFFVCLTLKSERDMMLWEWTQMAGAIMRAWESAHTMPCCTLLSWRAYNLNVIMICCYPPTKKEFSKTLLWAEHIYYSTTLDIHVHCTYSVIFWIILSSLRPAAFIRLLNSPKMQDFTIHLFSILCHLPTEYRSRCRA